MVGSGNDQSNRELSKLISKYDLEHNISLLGVRNDIPSILSSLDVLVSTSVDEAFGLVQLKLLHVDVLVFPQVVKAQRVLVEI